MSPTIQLPPGPPSPEDTIYYSSSFVPGKFMYVKDVDLRRALENAWQAISYTEGAFEFIKKDIESFTFSTDPMVYKIYGAMLEHGFDEHSGYSFGCVLREIQFMARYGEREYIKHTILSSRCSSNQ